MATEFNASFEAARYARGLRTVVLVCGLLATALAADRAFFGGAGAHRPVAVVAQAGASAKGIAPQRVPATVAEARVLGVAPADALAPSAHLVDGAPPESVVAF